MDSFPHKFSVIPEEIKKGIQVEGSLKIAQAFIEERSDYPELIEKWEYYGVLSFTLTGLEHEKKVKDTFIGMKALIGMIDEKIKNIISQVHLEIKFSGLNASIELGFNRDLLLSIIGRDEPNIALSSYHGKTDFVITSGLVLPEGLSLPYRDLITDLLNLSITAKGDHQLREILINFFYKELKQQAEDKDDTIKHKLANPVLNFLSKWADNENNIEFEQKYDQKYLDAAIYEHNQKTGDGYEYATEEYEDTKVRIKGLINVQLKEIMGGFFGGYFKILNCFDFNILDIKAYSKYQVTSLFLHFEFQGITEFIKETIIPLMK